MKRLTTLIGGGGLLALALVDAEADGLLGGRSVRGVDLGSVSAQRGAMGDGLSGALGGDLSVQIVCCGDPATKILVVVGTCNDDVEVVLGADLLVGQLSDSSRSLLSLTSDL